MKIALGADHGGYDLKQAVMAELNRRSITVDDKGCHSKASCDYPDSARDVALAVSGGQADLGILICTSGIGMSITANRFPGVRAALCSSPDRSGMSRVHNNSNVLVMSGADITPAQGLVIVDAWLNAAFEPVERHVRRLEKIEAYGAEAADTAILYKEDPELYEAIMGERKRQQDTINLIASENYASRAVRQASGSVLTNKYAEGYPFKRWYQGCEFTDKSEQLAIDRVKKLFGAEHANVQPHCGSSSNMAVYFAMLQPGDTILAMNLAHGGHLTHGNKVNFSGRFYNIVPYGVREDSGRIDYDEVQKLATEQKPKIIVAGASAYPRILDFPRFRQVADSVGALLLVDMAHIAGLVAGGVHPSPVPYADFVTSTTHKTLRGPRSGMILCKAQYAAAIDKLVFPGIQGGPECHTIASKAVCFHEALQPSFKAYAAQVVKNAAKMGETLMKRGYKLTSGGTENHLMLVDLSDKEITGRDAAQVLETVNIVVNKNAVPFDKRPPLVTSGIRLGSAAFTTRGMKEAEAEIIGTLIANVLDHSKDEAVLAATRTKVAELTTAFPAP